MAYDFKKTKVLVVESSPPLYELLKGVLHLFSVPAENIVSAYTVEEGFSRFCQGNQDLIIVDWMENPDGGLKLTRRIRTEKISPNPYVPILMTAGSSHVSRVLRARDMGVTGFLVKPFSAKTLAQKIERIIENPRPFVVHESYIGPDRRARQVPFPEPNKRRASPREQKTPQHPAKR